MATEIYFEDNENDCDNMETVRYICSDDDGSIIRSHLLKQKSQGINGADDTDDSGMNLFICDNEDNVSDSYLMMNELYCQDNLVTPLAIPVLAIGSKSSITSCSSSSSKATYSLTDHRQSAFKEWITAKRYITELMQRTADRYKSQEKDKTIQNRNLPEHQESAKNVRTKKGKIIKNISQKNSNNQENNNRQPLQSDVASNYKAWLTQKNKKSKIEKERTFQEKQRHSEKEMERKKQAETNYTFWLAKTADRPKPVPFGQGIRSLKASTSVMYKNPNPWVS